MTPMTLEELADLIRANSANTNRRIEQIRTEVTGQLLNIQNDVLDVKQSLDFAETVAAMRQQIDALEADVIVRLAIGTVRRL